MKDYTKAEHFQLGDAIEIVNKNAITEAEDVENGERFIIVGVHKDTKDTYGNIVIIDNAGDDLEILETELGAIKWVA